jgi:FkbM family methyltransferase
VCRTIHGFNVVVDGSDTSLTPHLAFHGYYELAEENFVKRILRGGDWMIDVGANVGTFALLAAQCVGPFGRVFTYEPSHRAHELLSKSLVMNWLHDRVVQREVAVGDKRENLQLSFVSQRLGDARVASDHGDGSTFASSARAIGEHNIVAVTVPCVCLDEEFPIDLPIKLLKIDVEGYEGSVLKGANRLLKQRCVDFILIEVLQEVAGPRWDQTLEELAKVTEFGYGIHRLKDDGSLSEEINLTTALEQSQRNIVLMARGQYN